jgi:plastocyanin
MKRSLILSLFLTAFTFARAEEHVVEQKTRLFNVTEITIKPGDKVVFKNSDDVTHNVFSVSPANPFNIRVQAPGASSTVEFKDPGTTEVRCAIHPGMKLVVTVK